MCAMTTRVANCIEKLTKSIRPKELSNMALPPVVSSVSSISKPPGVRTIANEIQKPPYEDRAVAPNVLPTAISLRIVRPDLQ